MLGSAILFFDWHFKCTEPSTKLPAIDGEG